MIIWLASFPRSGNTFFRALLHTLYGQNTYADYKDPEIGVMEVTAGEEPPAPIEELARREQVYFIKTHLLPSDASPAIYLLRDGRDSYPGFPFSKWTTNLVKSCGALDRGGFGRDRGGAEVERRWVRQKIGHFSSPSIAR